MSRTVESPHRVLARAVRRLRPRRAAALAAVAALAALAGGVTAPALAQAGTAPAHPGATGHTVAAGNLPAAQVAVSTAQYWTRSRMLSARNADLITVKGAAWSATAVAHPSGPAGQVAGAAPTQALRGGDQNLPASARSGVTPLAGSIGGPWTGSSFLPPATTTGKVFFSTTGNGQTENWVCSGSTVNSNGKDVVFVAGHCVYGTLGGQVPGETWHSNWEFVPDYNNGSAPYGVWTAHQLWTLNNYISNQDEGDDIGAAVINTNSAGQHIVNVVGGQGLAWNFADNQAVDDFGYPAAAPFNGATLQYCTGSEFDAASVIASTMGLACNFTGGSSGGPWLDSFGGEFGNVNGVNDYTDSGDPGDIFSAYFGTNADNLYNSVANL